MVGGGEIESLVARRNSNDPETQLSLNESSQLTNNLRTNKKLKMRFFLDVFEKLLITFYYQMVL